MALGLLTSPGTATFQLTLMEDGKPYVAPTTSEYKFDPTFTSTDSTVDITPDKKIAARFHVAIPAGEKSTAVAFVSGAIDPDGELIVDGAVVTTAPPSVKATPSLKHTPPGKKPVATVIGLDKHTGINSLTLPLEPATQHYSIQIAQIY